VSLHVASPPPIRIWGWIDAYATQRLTADASHASVNYEKAALRRVYRLAVKKGVLSVVPVIETPKVENRRSGFFETGDFAALLVELPAVLRPLIQFLKLTGWRRDEGRLLTWAAVDRDGGVIRLDAARSKSGEPGKLRSGWKRACKRAGLMGRRLHDLRRTCARDMRRAGLSESDIMELCGWETRAMFQRYCIRDEAALATAAAKLNIKVTAKSEPSSASSPSVSSGAAT
jgi:integrase